VEEIKDWVGRTDLTIQPVRDLADRTAVDAYEVPDQIRETVILRNPCCPFPWCDNLTSSTTPAQPPSAERGVRRRADAPPAATYRVHSVHNTVASWRVGPARGGGACEPAATRVRRPARG